MGGISPPIHPWKAPMKNRAVYLLSALALVGLRPVAAQQSTPSPVAGPAGVQVHLGSPEGRTFQASIDALAAQGHVAIVAEGVPFHRTLSDSQASRFSKEAPLSVMLPALADAYDYDVEYRNSVYLLKKRYSDIRDLPAVTLEEYSQAVQDILTVLRPFAASTQFPVRHIALDDIIPDLATTLTPEQMQALRDRKLAVAALTPEQKAKVWQFVCYFYAQTPFGKAEEAAFEFKGVPQASVGVDQKGYSQFGTTFHPFVYQTLSYDGQSVLRTFEQDTVMTVSPGGVTLSEPVLPPEQAEFMGKDAPITLAQEVTTLNKRGLHATVDAALRVKPVSIAGDGNATPKRMLQALADVYGLRVTEPSGKDKAVRLTRPLFRVPLEAAALPECVWEVVPEPLQRAIHRGERAAIERDAQKVLTAAPGDFLQATQRLDERRTEDRERPRKLQAEAVRRLHRASDLYVSQQKQVKFLPVAEMAEPDREAFGLALMTDLLDAVRANYDRPTPAYVLNFDQLILGGGPFIHEDSESKWKFAFNVAFLDASGTKLVEGPGTGGVAYYPPQQ